jgi:uncharacterized phage protein (TIGR02220 family)
MFYYKTAKWQKHNPIKANDEYTKKCLHWGTDKLRTLKSRLKEMELIEIEKRLNDKKQVEGWYVKLKYYNSTIPETTTPISPQVASQETNTNNNNNINTNNNINNNILSIFNNWNDNEVCECTTNNGEKCKRRSTYKINNKNYCNQHSKPIITKYIDIKNLGEDEINKERKEDIELVVRALNITLGTSYKATSQNTIKHINARLNEGFELDDFFNVIEFKYQEWKDTDMEKYLRPDTLFGTKFEIYLNQYNAKKRTK